MVHNDGRYELVADINIYLVVFCQAPKQGGLLLLLRRNHPYGIAGADFPISVNRGMRHKMAGVSNKFDYY